MFNHLVDRMAKVVKTMRGHVHLTEANIQDALREVRIALLEADVALPVVKDFLNTVREKALGQQVLQSLSPGQALVGVVHRELTQLMGGQDALLNLAYTPPVVILLAGLQGAGKTTTAGKLAKFIRENYKKKILMVSCDVYRPAAIDQLQTLAGQVEAEFFPSTPQQKPVEIALAALDHAKRYHYEILLIDTAGRLTIDAAMMQEIQELHQAVSPRETLLVVDAMQGQDAVNVARSFGEAVTLTGLVLTKLDGDARGGAALSARQVTGVPVKFAGIGEKLQGLEIFHPERMASRILGMGDVLSLIEDAQRSVDVAAAEKLAQKVKSGKGFDLQDFKEQIQQMRRMGGMKAMLDKMPAELQMAAQSAGSPLGSDDRTLQRIEGVINSMTPQERRKPEVIKASRKRRIASGAGVTVQEVNRLLKQFEDMQKMMKMVSRGGLSKMLRGMKGLLPGMR